MFNVRLICLLAIGLSVACGRARVVDDPKTWKPYVPPDGSFAIKAPNPPDIRGLGEAPKQYTFYGVDPKAMGPLLTIRTEALPPPGAPGIIPPLTADRFEQAYAGESGAIVSGNDVTLGHYTGHEIGITAGRRAPLVIRIFQVNAHQYWLEWNPTIAHSTDLANTFVIP